MLIFAVIPVFTCLAECHARKAYSAPRSTYRCGGDTAKMPWETKEVLVGRNLKKLPLRKVKITFPAPHQKKKKLIVSIETATATFQLFSEGT